MSAPYYPLLPRLLVFGALPVFWFAAAAAVAPATVYDIPRLEGIAIDGAAADWQERGFRVEVLNELNGRRRPVTEADANFRLGWDERGILGLLQVGDTVFAESDKDTELWRKDSVELFLALGPEFKDHYQLVLSPGLDPKHPKLRTQYIDQQRTLKTKLDGTVAVLRTPQGYDLEFLLPWANLTATPPAQGATFAFQLQVNNAGSSGVQSCLAWFPATGAHADTGKMQRLRLAATASPLVETVAAAGYERLRQTWVEVTATPGFIGKPAVVRRGDDGTVLGQAEFVAAGRLAQARLNLPMPPPGKPYPPLQVSAADTPAITLTLPDADRERAAALARAEMQFSPGFVFTGSVFPKPEFRDPTLIEDAIGPYTLQAVWYDTAGTVVSQPAQPGRYGTIVTIQPTRGEAVEKRFCTLFQSPKSGNWWQERLQAGVTMPMRLGLAAGVIQKPAVTVSEFIHDCVAKASAAKESTAITLAGLYELNPGHEPLSHHLDPWAENEKWWHLRKAQTGNLKSYRYLVFEPQTVDGAKTKLPLILFLHGSGERGDDLERVAIHGPLKYARAHPKEFPFQVVAPQCPEHVWWDVWQLQNLLDEVMTKYPVDPDRVYLTGLSMGGFGSWRLAAVAPERFAAVAPICGGGDPFVVSLWKELPFWVIHGGKDTTVPLALSAEPVAALRAIHGRVRFTVLPEAGHDSWTPMYNNPEFYAWLLQQKRGAPTQPPATATGQAGD